jgi:hypothetical protein
MSCSRRLLSLSLDTSLSSSPPYPFPAPSGVSNHRASASFPTALTGSLFRPPLSPGSEPSPLPLISTSLRGVSTMPRKPQIKIGSTKMSAQITDLRIPSLQNQPHYQVVHRGASRPERSHRHSMGRHHVKACIHTDPGSSLPPSLTHLSARDTPTPAVCPIEVTSSGISLTNRDAPTSSSTIYRREGRRTRSLASPRYPSCSTI